MEIFGRQNSIIDTKWFLSILFMFWAQRFKNIDFSNISIGCYFHNHQPCLLNKNPIGKHFVSGEEAELAAKTRKKDLKKAHDAQTKFPEIVTIQR